ncbi:MAG TPA: transposase [Thiobacillus sp.]
MTRPLRIEFPGAVYHVTSRGDRREPIFDDDVDRQAFVDVVALALKRFDACVLAFCLMDNHYHLVLNTRQPNLSALMHLVNGVYTQAYNRRHAKVGHLFQGRFKAILVDRDAYLLEVCRYVDLNPVRAAMVADPAQWPWSSYQVHTGLVTGLPWLDTSAVQGYLLGYDVVSDRDRALAASRYAALVAQGKDVRLWDEALRGQIYLGDESFMTRMQALLAPEQAAASDVPGIQRRSPPMSLAQFFNHHPRNEAIAQAHIVGGYSMSVIAKEIGLSVSRVSRIVRGWEAKMAKDKA